MNDQIWGWLLSLIGVVGFILAGKKIWWAWYINIFNQIVWTAYAVVTEQYGFLVGVVVYTIVFVKNAKMWTQEHIKEKNDRD